MAHASDDVEVTPSFDPLGHPLDEESYQKVCDNILEQLMEIDEINKLKVWSSDVERGMSTSWQGRLRLRGKRS